MKNFRKITFVVLLLALTYLSGAIGCGSGDQDDLLKFPFIVSIDNTLQRVFVIDNQNNRINLVDPATNRVVVNDDDKSLLSDEDPVIIPLFPSNGVVAFLGGNTSRLFIIGANATPTQQVTVLDYNGGQTFEVAGISPINVSAGSTQDVLVGLAVDSIRQRLFVTNSTTGMLHAFDINTGQEDPNSPITIDGEPTRLSVDLDSNLLAVANSSSNMISFVDLTDLTAPVMTLDVGNFSRDVAMATNGAGTVLFMSGSQVNIAQVYILNLADLAASNLVFQLIPPAPTEPRPDPELLTGNLNQVTAGNLTNGQMAGFYTQSSGDVLALDLTSDLSTITPTVISIGAVSGEGIASLFNSSNQVTTVYFASPGTGLLTVVDPIQNQLVDQIP